MKMLIKARLAMFGLLLTGWIGTNAQSVIESEVPGDNFSLEGALELFKESSSPEEFERKLNSPDSKVNNLDLNSDGYIDYIRVINRREGNVHVFIIQAILSEREFQDVAVIELEKLANGKAVLQITGDADVYGIETIIEPTEEVYVNAGTMRERRIVNVWMWPTVQYVYQPYYTVYVSPWYWSYRPFWWSPWRPVAYYVYDPWWRPYRSYYSYCHSHRIAYAYEIYRPYRTTSVIVHNYYGTQINNYRSRPDTRGRDRYADQRNNNGSRSNAHNRSNSGSRSDSGSGRTTGSDADTGDASDGRRRVVDRSEFRKGQLSHSNEQAKETMKTRAVQKNRPVHGDNRSDDRSTVVKERRTVNENNGANDRSNVVKERRSETVVDDAPRQTRTVKETPSGWQKSSDRTEHINRSERPKSQPTYENTQKSQPRSNGDPRNQSRSSDNSGSRTERVSKPDNSSQGSHSNKQQKSRSTRGQN
jgi:hypothetical protein